MLNNLLKTTKNSKRKGRGIGSKKGGHTVGRGSKGARSRSGFKSPRKGFEGGQMPLSRRLPKLKGFTRSYFKTAKNRFEFSLDDLNHFFKDGEKVNMESFREKGLVQDKSKAAIVKILGTGEVKKKLNIEGIQTTASAAEKITAAGGKII